MAKKAAASKGRAKKGAAAPVASSVASSGSELATNDPRSAGAVGGRIAEARGRMTQAEFAAQLGVHEGTLGRYERGERLPDVEFINALSAHADVSPLWLLYGEGPRSFDQAAGGAPRPEWERRLREANQVRQAGSSYSGRAGGADTVYVNLYDVSVGGGTGKIPEHERVSAVRAFSAAWLWSRFNANEADVYLVSVTGDSMAPLICEGDVILVDRRERDIRRDDVYVIRMDDALLVKNVQLLPGGVVRCWSENEKVSGAFTVNIHDPALAPGFEVIGRVLWRGGTLRR